MASVREKVQRALSKGGNDAEEDDGELSDSTKAVRAIQRDLEAADKGERATSGGRAGSSPPRKSRQNGSGRSPPQRDGSRRSKEDEPLGDDRTVGSITGIKLGEFAPGAKRKPGAEGFKMRGKDGKERTYKQGLESMVNEEAGNFELPDAPEGSYKRRRVAELEAGRSNAGDRPTGQVGIGSMKIWDFVQGPDSDSGEEAQGGAGSALDPGGKEKKKADKAKDKKAKKDKKKAKKKAKKKEKKAKKKKKQKTKQKESSSSSSSSDDSG